MIRLNENTVEVGYIKQLLHSFNLPTCKIGDKLPTANNTKNGDNIIFQNYLYSNGVDKDNNSIFSKTRYKMNDFIPNLTKKLELQNNIYDFYTHKYLGDYLRFLRDYKHIDLMSMYNCCSYESPQLFTILGKAIYNVKEEIEDEPLTTDSSIISYISSTAEYVTFAFPVKFNKKYTIGLD